MVWLSHVDYGARIEEKGVFNLGMEAAATQVVLAEWVTNVVDVVKYNHSA
jgi:hypothetical protein